MALEDQVYAETKYMRRIKAFLLVFIMAGLLGLGGLAVVLYAFHLDPDTVTVATEVTHLRQGCPHSECAESHTAVSTSYGSWEVGVSGILYLIYLCAAGIGSGVLTEK